jgi:hypothetical protein
MYRGGGRGGRGGYNKGQRGGGSAGGGTGSVRARVFNPDQLAPLGAPAPLAHRFRFLIILVYRQQVVLLANGSLEPYSFEMCCLSSPQTCCDLSLRNMVKLENFMIWFELEACFLSPL